MRPIDILKAVIVAGLIASPALAQGSGGNEGGGAGSNQVHCSPAKNGDAAADPNCAQRDPPMPAPGGTAMPSGQPTQSQH